MASYDLFNGDADGLCALIQLRLASPKDATLISGVKRDIALLQSITPKPGDDITVLDISMDKNMAALQRCITNQAKVFYADHHKAGEIPNSPLLEAHIHTNANTCTALIINHYLAGRYPLWAVVGAFGDNLLDAADRLALQVGLSSQQIKQLKLLGSYLNYNGYGEQISDLLYSPQALFRVLVKYASPLDFIAQEKEIFQQLAARFDSDLLEATQTKPYTETPHSRVFILPNQDWSQRVSGVLSNQLANQMPNKAHAILTHKQGGGYLVSIRAPLARKFGAEQLASQFKTGGGREAAAGINHLTEEQLPAFIHSFKQHFMPKD